MIAGEAERGGDNRLQTLNGEYNAHIKAADDYAKARETEDECGQSFREAWRIAQEIIATKATTTAGCAIQLRTALAHAGYGGADGPYGPDASECQQYERDFIDAVRSVLVTLDGMWGARAA